MFWGEETSFLGTGGIDNVPDAVNWANVGPGNSPQVNAFQTISGLNTTITLVATLSAGTYGAGGKTFRYYLNGVAQSGAALISAAAVLNGATISLVVGNTDQVHFEATKGAAGSGTSWSATITVTVLETGQTLDTFTVSVDAPP